MPTSIHIQGYNYDNNRKKPVMKSYNNRKNKTTHADSDKRYNSVKNKLLTVAVSVLTALLILSVSISAPILVRPFYYIQIDMRNLAEKTGYSHEQITEAYDDMLDYCVGITDEFDTGDLAWSESGKEHFTDVRGLFLLDINVMVACMILMTIYLLYSNISGTRPYMFRGHTPYFHGSTTLLAAFAVIGGLCAVDFDRAFTVFHQIFFPGKDNWIFDPHDDEIIRILPEGFFASCGAFILAVLLVLCAVMIISSVLSKTHRGRVTKHT